MKHLVDEYFKRDLNASEEEQLAQWLAGSPEEAQRFAKKMEELYKDSGLPQPLWPGKPLPLPKPGLPFKPILSSVLILALFGFVFYKCSSKVFLTSNTGMETETPAPATPFPTPAPHKEKPVVKPKAKAASVKTTSRAQTPPAPMKPPVKKAVVAPSTQPAPLPHRVNPPAPIATLPRAAAAPAPPRTVKPGREIQQLSVVVNPEKSGLVTVKVFDNRNNQVQSLFAGILPPEERTFTWDGRTSGGGAASPGVYFIEVQSGTKVMRKEVHVQGE